MKRWISIVGALALIPALAWAEPKTSDDWYKVGEDHYNLGNFDGAVEAFTKAYELETKDSKKAAYLFNIAQAYRQAKNCQKAQFFYKRYLAVKDADTTKPLDPTARQQIEDRIRELDECAAQQDKIAEKPPDQPIKPEPDPKRVANPDQPDPPDHPDQPDEPKVVAGTDGVPKVLSLRAYGGGAKLTLANLDVPLQATASLIGGYPVRVNEKMTVDIGAGFSFTPVPFKNMNGDSKSAALIGLVANIGGTYHVASKVGLRGEVGVGALVFSGVNESPFTGFAPTTGALSMLHLRVGVSGDYAITPNFIATVMPVAFSYSPAASGLETVAGEKVNPTAIDFMVGVGYRM